MITIVYRDYNKQHEAILDETVEDMRHYHPIEQMEIVKQAILDNTDIKLYTNHHQIADYIGYLIRNGQVKPDQFMLDTSGGEVLYTDKGDLCYGWYSDVTELGFGLLFGKTGDFSNLDIL